MLNIAAIGNAEHYHHATDAPRYVDHSTVQHYGDQVLGLTRAWAFDGQAPTLTADGDLHFFPLWRGLTVRYPAAVGTGLGCLAVIAALGAVAVRARSLRWKRVLGSVWGLSWRAVSASAAAGLVQLGAMAMQWAPESGLGPNPLLVWMFAGGALIGAGLTAQPRRTRLRQRQRQRRRTAQPRAHQPYGRGLPRAGRCGRVNLPEEENGPRPFSSGRSISSIWGLQTGTPEILPMVEETDAAAPLAS